VTRRTWLRRRLVEARASWRVLRGDREGALAVAVRGYLRLSAGITDAEIVAACDNMQWASLAAGYDRDEAVEQWTGLLGLMAGMGEPAASELTLKMIALPEWRRSADDPATWALTLVRGLG
jgi:hypothetical protein